jgi:hypothetical protein
MTITPNRLSMDQAATYQIKLQGRLSDNWSNWFEGMVMSVSENENGSTLTVLTGPVLDQAALHGLLSRIRDLSLPLLSVECLETL